MRRRGLAVLLLSLFSVPSLAQEEGGSKTPYFGFSIPIGVPHPVNIELDAAFQDSFNYGAAAGWFTLQTNGVKVSLTNAEAKVRWFPSGGSFFFGSSLGYQWITAERTDEVSAGGSKIKLDGKGTIKTPYVTPHIGWFIVKESGFVLGWDLGVQLPFGASTDLEYKTTDPANEGLLDAAKGSSEFKELEKDVKDIGNKIGKWILPMVTLIRIGWVF